MNVEKDLIEDFGYPAYNEFMDCSPSDRQSLRTWWSKMKEMSDEDFLEECVSCISSAAVHNSEYGTNPRVWFPAFACMHEADKRKMRDGHAKVCSVENIYQRAMRDSQRAFGLDADPSFALCDCGKEGSK